MNLFLAIFLFSSVCFSEVIPILEKQSTILRFDEPIKSFYFGNTEFVQSVSGVQNPKEIIIRGKKPGETDLKIHFKNQILHRTILVLNDSIQEPFRTLRNLSTLQNFQIEKYNDQFSITGKAQTLKELQAIFALTTKPEVHVQADFEVAPNLIQKSYESLIQKIRELDLEQKIQVTQKAQRILISGSLPATIQKDTLTKQLQAIYPFLELDLKNKTDLDRSIYLKAYILEMKENTSSQLGVQWETPLRGTLTLPAGSPEFRLDALNGALSSWSSSGKAKVLAEPSFQVKTPGNAKLFSGGEIPYRTTTRYSSQLQWKPYGLELDIQTLQDHGDSIRVHFHGTQSYLDANTTQSQDIPGIRKNEMKTELDLPLEEAILLAGLQNNYNRTRKSGIPVLRSIPLLGFLFGSQEEVEEKSHLMTVLFASQKTPTEKFDFLQNDKKEDSILHKNFFNRERGL